MGYWQGDDLPGKKGERTGEDGEEGRSYIRVSVFGGKWLGASGTHGNEEGRYTV